MPEPIFVKLSMYIVAPEPISTVYFISLCVCVCIPPFVARQRLFKHVPAATNARNKRTVEVLCVCVGGSVYLSPCRC
jgi:hypothetical protein